MHAMYVMIGVLCVLAIGYRFYSKFIATKVLELNDSLPTPAYVLNDGHNYHPTNKWVLFGHHFAAISGAGPLIGPVLAAQFGYLPGLLWILIGVVLGGAVQDFVILVLSIRREGKSLAQIAYLEIGRVAGGAATAGILFVLVIALAGLGKVVVKALGGEEVLYPAGTRFIAPTDSKSMARIREHKRYDNVVQYKVPARTVILYLNGARLVTSEPLILTTNPVQRGAPPVDLDTAVDEEGTLLKGHELDLGKELAVKTGVRATREIAGSTWGSFTIALTIPIALFVGWYMYRLRKGKVVEASIVGGLMVLGAVYLGSYLTAPKSLAEMPSSLYTMFGGKLDLMHLQFGFDLTQRQVGISMAIYGFVASILPVWLLLAPRDYLSSFLKIGTVAILVLGVIVANPVLQAPAINEVFLAGGPIVGKGHGIFPFVFITIMCGAISGFHSLVSSGTTPKMIQKETQARMIGYGAMLIEGLVGIVALIAAASMPTSWYYNMNTSTVDLPQYQQNIAALAEKYDDKSAAELGTMERLVGENLAGRTGGAVTLAVGMVQIFDGAAKNIMGRSSAAVRWVGDVAPFWYHFAIMFEALFILTTIDAGTRVGRFLLQEVFGKIKPAWGRTHWWPGAIAATGLLVVGWWYFLDSSTMDAIWPMFGIANQLLAVMALAIAGVSLTRCGKARYVWVTAVPMTFVTVTTLTTAFIMVSERVNSLVHLARWSIPWWNAAITGILIIGIVICTVLILGGGLRQVLRGQPVRQEVVVPGMPRGDDH